MFIDEETKQQILARATLEATLDKYSVHAPGSTQKKRLYVCPFCGKEMQYHPGKNLVKCFHCEWGTNSPVTFLMETAKLDYPEALKKLADDFGVIIPDQPKPDTKPKATAKPKSYCARQLEASGLTAKDVRARCHTDGSQLGLFLNLPDSVKSVGGPVTFDTSPFFQGTMDRYGHVSRTGDDMVIQYFDLDGHPVTYRDRRKGGSSEEKPFFRVRWQYPESHMTAKGDSPKYLSPAGSGLHLYVPERLRQAFAKGETVENLFFTEGEKKAEAVSRYVGPAFGMGGIHCLTAKDSRQLPEDVIRFIEQCHTRRVYFIMDSDWNDLGSHLTPDRDVMSRPKTFANAAITFRDWFRTLASRELFVDVYLVLGNPGTGKGVDDALMLMRPNEADYASHILKGTDNAAAGGETPYFRVVKISAIADAKIREIWHLNDPDSFTEAHLKELAEMKEGFTIMRNLCRINDKGERESVDGILDDETFWTVNERRDRAGNTSYAYSYNYERALYFLNRRGFYKQQADNGDWLLVKVDNRQIQEVTEVTIQDYVMDFVRGYKREGVNKEDILNMLHRAKSQYLGHYQMTSLFPRTPEYAKPDRDSQILMFHSRYWRVSADGVEEHPLSSASFDYWQKDLRDIDASRTPERLITVDDSDGNLLIKVTPTDAKCDFLRFLLYASWFDWNKYLDNDRRPIPPLDGSIDFFEVANPSEISADMLAKMTAIGYLMHHYDNPAVAKAVIAMDEHISPAGQSNGRSGKSLVSMALKHVTNVLELPGKGLDLTGDRFVFSQVNSQTRVITLDDIDERFDFEQLFPSITSGVTVNEKGQKRFTLSGHDKPKFFITTNHTILASNGSARDRQFKIAFSNYFDEHYKPEREFGTLFFSEDWDPEQWNLFYNFMAECLEVYFLAQHNHWGVSGSGLIEAPCEALDKRLLRQLMTEGFYQWMLEYMGIDELDPYNPEGTRLGERLQRLEMYNSYVLTLSQAEVRFFKAPKFRDRVLYFCHYFGYVLNPQLPQNAKGEPVGFDKSGGTEFYTIALKPFDSTPH